MPGQNGTVVTTESLTNEIGTAVERERLFTTFDDGKLFTPQDTGARQIDKMLRVDGKARSIEQVLTLPLRQAPWEIEAADGDQGEADWIRGVLTKPANAGGMSIPLELVLAQMTGARLFCRAFFEKVFKVEDGQLVYDKLAWRPPASCQLSFDKTSGAFKGFRQRVPYDHPKADTEGYVSIPAIKAFVFIHGQHRRPLEGVSDLDAALAIWETKQKVRYLWLTFLENQTMPKAIVKADTNDPGDAHRLAVKVATLKGGGTVGIGKDQSVDPFQSDGSGAGVYQEAIRFLDSEMDNSVLAGFLGLTSSAASGKGSFALSRDSTDFFLQSCQAVLQEMAAAFSSYVIGDLIRWNRGLSASVPKLKLGPLVQEQADQALSLLQALAGQPLLNPAIPREFLELLIEKVSTFLSIDATKVRAAIDKSTSGADNQGQALQQGVDAATRLVQQALPGTSAVPAQPALPPA